MKMDIKRVKELCQPALLYLILACIALVWCIFNKFHFVSLFIKVIWIIFWTWFLNFLCKQGYSGISWFLVVVPFLMAFIMVAIVVEVKQRQYIY
jgi:hypothetical protein